VLQALEGAVPGVNVTTTGAGAEPTLNITCAARTRSRPATGRCSWSTASRTTAALRAQSQRHRVDRGAQDASAAAIYGSRGSNGVILVTSKKGSTGRPRVSYAGYTGTQRVTGLPTLMNAEQFADFKCVRLRTSATQSCDAVLTATELANRAAGVNTNWLDEGTQTGRQQQHDSRCPAAARTPILPGGSLLGVDGIARNDNSTASRCG
jgi:TonB-dependent SusC/RagA subfamily outer membrane receptor